MTIDTKLYQDSLWAQMINMIDEAIIDIYNELIQSVKESAALRMAVVKEKQ
jgi:hypothetical protein